MAGFTLRIISSALLALFLFLPVRFSYAGQLPQETLRIQVQTGHEITFLVEVASSKEERETGLMDRDTMLADHGMLFDFGETRPVYMWMKNTYLPLDMLFITDKGQIIHIKHDALPLSEDIIDSHGPVRYVLEIKGGIAARKNIVEGSIVKSPTIDRVTGLKQ